VIRVRERFVNNGLDDARNHRLHTQRRAQALDGEQEAYLMALSCSPCPLGQASFPLRLLAGRMVELGYPQHVSHETVRTVLKKTNSNPGCAPCWCIAPEASAAFVWRMEAILAVSTPPMTHAFHWSVGMRSAKLLLQDKRESLPAHATRAA